jgi:cyanophycinase-like exopeptidase
VGPVALHGGGEFSPADEPFLAALLEAARPSLAERTRACRPAAQWEPADPSDPTPPGGDRLRVALLTTAAGRQRPELAAANGDRAFRAAAAVLALPIRIDHVPAVDPPSAAAPTLCGLLAGADLVYLPGGDPGLVIDVLAGSLAWRSVLAANARGAVVAGASAGAMAMAEWTWTPRGGAPGLGLVHGCYVVPHDDPRRRGTGGRDAGAPAGLGRLGLAEATGVIGRPGGPWRVVGPGPVSWRAADGADLELRDGEVMRLER